MPTNQIGSLDQLRNKNLTDQQGLQTERLFLYKIKNHKDKGFIKEQSISILHLENLTTIEVARTEAVQSLTQENKENNSKGNTAVIVPRISGMDYATEQHIEDDGFVLIASFGEITINNGSVEQELFFLDNIQRQLLKPIKQHGKQGLYNPTDFSLTNVKDITNNYNALKFLYTWEDEIINPSSLNISMNNYSLLSKVMAKGEVAGKKHQDIDLKILDGSSKLSLITQTPTSTNYKLSMFSHWLDANRTLSFVKAKAFINKTNLKTLFDATNADFTGWSATEIEDAYKVVISMMKLTQAYATNFSEYRTGTDGKIAGDAVINGIKLVDFADKTPINAIDGFVEAWKNKYPGQVESAGFKILLEVIVMLSNHINSTYAIAKGNNDFMKVYLPWYFVPQTAINKTLADDGDMEVIIKSEYFDFTQVNPLQIKDEYKDISGYVAHDLNGWISQPELPNKISPINKFARPGDISTTSDDSLKYLFYIPFESEQVLENLYGELHTTTQTGWHDEGITRRYNNKSWSSVSDTSSKLGGEIDITPFTTEIGGTSHSIFRTYADDVGLDRNLPVKSVENISDITAFLENPDESVLVKLLNLPLSSRLKVGSMSNIVITLIDSDDGGGRLEHSPILKLSISFDYELEIDGSQTITSIQHKGTIYDKLNWRSVANSLTNGNDKYDLSLTPDNLFNLNIDKINEINIQSIWLDYITISISNGTKTISFDNIELPSIDDETLTNFSILV